MDVTGGIMRSTFLMAILIWGGIPILKALDEIQHPIAIIISIAYVPVVVGGWGLYLFILFHIDKKGNEARK